MGTGISIICQNCGYEKDFMLGIGMMYSSLEKVIDLSPHRKKILDILQNHIVIKDEFRWDNPFYEHRLYRCSSCNQLHERFYVKIEYDDKKVYETKFKCPKCKNELKAVEDEKDVKKHPCPECNNKKLFIQEMVLWD
jgi:DNA-directed RNA polymerase subunit RPC12/RpoP